MKSLAIDSSSSRISFFVINDTKKMSLSIDVGLHQSEKLLPCIDFILSQVDLKPEMLDFTALNVGPGSFTGLRLAFSALKALQLSFGIPIYGVNTLDSFALPFLNNESIILSVLDAKKERFYACAFDTCKKILEDGDYTTETIFSKIPANKQILVVGPDAEIFVERTVTNKNVTCFKTLQNSFAEQVYIMAEKMYTNGEKPLEEYIGPTYIRKSEAEENLKQ